MFTHRKKGQDSKNTVSKPKKTEPGARKLTSDNAFHFYEGIGKPTNQVAKSLTDFRRKIDSVNLSSVVFHLKRGDFENWIRDAIGDDILATRIGKINPYDPNVRAALQTTLDLRLRELRETTPHTKAGAQDTIKIYSPIES